MLRLRGCFPHQSFGVVYLVGSGVVQILSLEVDVGSVFLRQPSCLVERGRPPGIIFQEPPVLFLEILAVNDFKIAVLQVFHAFVKNLGDVCASEVSVITIFINQVTHTL